MSAPLPGIVKCLDRFWRILDGFFPEQLEAFWRPIEGRVGVDKRGVLTTRRAGKTWGCLGVMMTEALMFPNTHYRFVMLTQDQVRDVVWPLAHKMLDEFGIEATILDDALKIRFPDKSMIHGYGADKKGWMGRLRGQESRICAIDESGEFSRPEELYELVNSVLRPTLVGPRGTMFLMGTPGKWKQGMFYDVTATDRDTGMSVGTGRYHGWTPYNWGAANNPHMAEQFIEEMAAIRREHPGVDVMTIPSVLREWFGRWEEDDTNRVYELDPTKNRYEGPWVRKEHPNAQYVGGIDLGWNDATSVTVGAFEPDTDFWTAIESHKRVHAPLQFAVDLIRKMSEEYPGILWVCDPARKQLMMELQMRCDICIEPAEKADKGDYITLMNRDLRAGNIKIVDFDHSPLVEEMVDLRWIRRPNGKVEEQPGLPNDCCDGHLYAWRRSRHFRYRETEKPPAPGTPEWYKREAERMRRRAIERQLERARQR